VTAALVKTLSGKPCSSTGSSAEVNTASVCPEGSCRGPARGQAGPASGSARVLDQAVLAERAMGRPGQVL
jgi:hypothetical protein